MIKFWVDLCIGFIEVGLSMLLMVLVFFLLIQFLGISSDIAEFRQDLQSIRSEVAEFRKDLQHRETQ